MFENHPIIPGKKQNISSEQNFDFSYTDVSRIPAEYTSLNNQICKSFGN